MIAPDVVKKIKSAARVADWVTEEMADADFNDRRLNRRLDLILSDLAQNNGAVYGLAAIGVSVTAGFGVGMVFKGGGGSH